MTKAILMLASSMVFIGGLAGCTFDSEQQAPEHTAQAEQSIVNGELDTTHQAVVRHESQGLCTATIVKVDGATGYALTAAHCLHSSKLGVLKQGDDADKPDREYKITAHAAHPDYTKAAAFDFAMVTFTGADENTPVLPILDPNKDSYKPGFPLTLIGYGVTKVGGGGENSQRRVIVNNLASVGFLRFFFDQKNGGFCSGDSGGPGLTLQQPERIAAVIQAVTINSNCLGGGIAGRVSAVYDTFIEPYLEDQPFKKHTCGACRSAVTSSESACSNLISDCFDSTACQQYTNCLNQCTTNQCAEDCATMHAAGAEEWSKVERCGCQVCAEECSDDAECDDLTSDTTTSSAAVGAGGGGVGVGGSDMAGSGGGQATGAGGSDDGNEPPATEGGCGSCATAARSDDTAAAWLLGMMLLLRRRRRRR